MESINGFEAWDDMLGFNNGGWWADELSRWKVCLFKVQRGGKMFILENIREIQSFFFSFLTFFFFHSQARETVFRFTTAGGSGPRCNKLKHLMPESYGWKADRIFRPIFS